MPRRFPITSLLILAALQDGRLHGYGIMQRARALDDSDRTLRASTVYDAIARLVQQELVVDAGSHVVDGRLRRYYALTETGRRALDEQTDRPVRSARAIAHPARGPRPTGESVTA